MRLLIFGKSGQLARELQRAADVIALDRTQADLTDPDACAAIILATDADAVINAAAYTAVDQAETDVDLAKMINTDAPAAMARAAAEKDLPFLHISTDYVFNGDGQSPWREDDKTDPLGIYGASKLKGEQGVLAAGSNAAILRTSWVFSAHGNNFVKTMLRLSETRSALSIVNDQFGGPTPAADIAVALVQMARAMIGGQTGGIYHFCGAPFVSWNDFADEIYRQSERQVAISGIPSKDYPTPAQRPKNSRLDCAKIKADFNIDMPDWRVGLTDVLEELKVT